VLVSGPLIAEEAIVLQTDKRRILLRQLNMAQPAETTKMAVDQGKSTESPMESQVQRLAEKVWSKFACQSSALASII